MRRFDEEQTLDHLADAGRIDLPLIEALAASLPPRMRARRWSMPVGWIAALGDYIEQNDSEMRERPDLFDRRTLSRRYARQAAPRSRACARCCSRAAPRAWCGAATAICTSAISR